MTRKYIIFYSIITVLIFSLFAPSCANTSTPPSGGLKDTLAPKLVSSTPAMNHINHPVLPKHSGVSFEFNEYVVLKDAIKNIYLSPPSPSKPKFKIKGKSVVISFVDTLAPNTTYTLDLGQAIADNNEGNLFPKYVYSFSTGESVDSFYTSGTVVDAVSMLAKDKITILFHTDPSDSAVFNLLPVASAKTDIWGFFSIRNIKSGKYRVYAIDDKNDNNKYDPSQESVAFLDTLFVVDSVMRPDIPALSFYDVKDTVNCLARPSYIRLYLFNEVSKKQYLKNKGREAKRMMFLSFAAPYVKIDSLAISGVDSSKIITEFNVTQDSLAIWINDPKPLPDTLLLSVKYMKTDDSTNLLVSTLEEVKMAAPKKKYKKDKFGDNVEVVDTVAKYKLIAPPENVEQDGFIFEFDYPLAFAPWDSLKFKYVTTKQQIKDEDFSVVQDSTNIRRFIVRPKNPLLVGYEYIIKLPHRQFIDINGLPCDSLEKKISIPNDDKLSSITLDLTEVNGDYIVELISEKRDKTYRQFRINSSKKLLFPYLKPDKYSIRITEDRNRNGLFDTGSVIENKQPEKVKLYKFGSESTDNAYIIEIPERMELEQTINISEMFK